MNTKIIDLKNQKRSLLNEMEKVTSAAIQEQRAYNADEKAKYDALQEADKICDQAIANAEMQEKLSQTANVFAEEIETRSSDPRKSKQYAEFRKALNSTHAFDKIFLQPEHRNLNNTATNLGGAIVPEIWSQEVIKAIDYNTFAGRLCRKIPVLNADQLNLPVWTGINGCTRVTEVTAASSDASTPFASKAMTPFPMSLKLPISRKLLRNATIDVDSFIKEEFARQVAYTTETELMTGAGSGSSQMWGIFTANAAAISTGQDVTTGTTNVIKYADLVNTQFKIDSKFHHTPKTAWIMNGATMKLVLGMVDTANRPILQPNVQTGQPGTILGDAVYVSNYAPNNPTSGLYAAAYGCFDYYVIAESLGVSVEIQADPATDSNIYWLRAENYGLPVLEAAFSRLKVL